MLASIRKVRNTRRLYGAGTVSKINILSYREVDTASWLVDSEASSHIQTSARDMSLQIWLHRSEIIFLTDR